MARKFNETAWIAQELAKATKRSDADRYLTMGPEFTQPYHHELARQIQERFPD